MLSVAGAWAAAQLDSTVPMLTDARGCGSVVGFLFGFSLASSLAAYHLLEEYKLASAALQASVEELQISTEKVIT